MEKFKVFLPDLLAVLLFVLISFSYFVPAVFEGRILYQHDTSAGRGAGEEGLEYFERTGERTRWTNGLFGGMPTYQLAPSYRSTDVLSRVMDAYHLCLPENVWYVFVYLLGFYILMRVLTCGAPFNFSTFQLFNYSSVILSVLGSIVWAFSSYFFIIIAAGHIWKVWALAYLPPLIAGIVLCYRGSYLCGFIVTALFTAFEVKANHVQMTYYYLFVILLVVVAFIVEGLKGSKALRAVQSGSSGSRFKGAARRSTINCPLGFAALPCKELSTINCHVLKATLVCIAAGVIGVLMNISNLYHTWEYSKESMRGGSELVKSGGSGVGGLDRDYITQWSYGIGETWSLLIPNVKGGASVPLSSNVKAMEKADVNLRGLYGQIGQYWGEQPMTSGPVYVGAFVVMLFVLGVQVFRGPLKWALLAATFLSIFLSWGKNFMFLTDFFIDYVPMYGKFRTVSSILVIAEFTIPLLAMLGLYHLGLSGSKALGAVQSGSSGSRFKVEGSKALGAVQSGSSGSGFFAEQSGKAERKGAARRSTFQRFNVSTFQRCYNLRYKIITSYVLTAGACVLFALMPRVFFSDFVSSQEMRALSQFPPAELNMVLSNLRLVREGIFTSDCWRSFLIITLGTLLLLWGLSGGSSGSTFKVQGSKALGAVEGSRFKVQGSKRWMYALCGIALLCLVDMWSVNKRYLNDGMFVEKSVRDMGQPMTATDRMILEDKGLDYRVLNLASNTFNENETSYYHKSIGGYHAAKLRRYQDLIDAYISPEMGKMMGAIAEAQGDMRGVAGDSLYPVLNMLNTRYVIMPLASGETVPIMNPYAYGNGWFVDGLVYAENANAELDGLGGLDLRHEAVADVRFRDVLGDAVEQDTLSIVRLTAYEPNELRYDVRSGRGGVVVFSEIFYPGWTATVDGERAELGRVDYVLRALNVSAGEHEVVLTFKPASIDRTERVAYMASGLLLVVIVVGLLGRVRRLKG